MALSQIPKGSLVKGPKLNQYVGTVPSIFQLLKLATMIRKSPRPGVAGPPWFVHRGDPNYLQVLGGPSK